MNTMKKISQILGFFSALTLVLFMASCGDDSNTDGDNGGDGPGGGGSKLDLTITVKGLSGNDINNNKVLCVIGLDNDGMNWLDYELGKVDGESKVVLKDPEQITKLSLDTIYMRLNAGGDKIGGIEIDGKANGTYTFHVVDGNLNAWVGPLSITEDIDDQKEVQTKPLGRALVEVWQTTIVSPIDGVQVGVFGTSLDTTGAVFIKSFDDIPEAFAPYYSGTTSEQPVSGVKKQGVVYFHWIPARDYYFNGYHPVWSDEGIPNTYKKIDKNSTTSVLLTFQK